MQFPIFEFILLSAGIPKKHKEQYSDMVVCISTGTSDLTCQEFLQLQLQRDELQKLQQELQEIRRNSASSVFNVSVGLFG